MLWRSWCRTNSVKLWAAVVEQTSWVNVDTRAFDVNKRLKAFSDGVVAIIITIMVLELKAPAHGGNWAALIGLTPIFLSYVLSFVYVAIYWNNHHHLLHVATKVDSAILWANMHLLFWLSLIPFATAWMGENHFAPLPTALYGVALLMPAIAYYVLQIAIVKNQGKERALGRGPWKQLQGQDFTGPVPDSDCVRVRRNLDF